MNPIHSAPAAGPDGGAARRIYLPDAVGGGYGAFWRFRGRYRVVKGSRASKKSKTAALWFLYHLMKYPAANLVVVRKVLRTLRDSCFAELQWAMQRLGVEDLWDCTVSPLEMTYRPTGQKIYFRGLDDAMKIASIAVPVGVLCWLWLEEAYEVTDEADFQMLDECIRGAVPPGLFKQLTLTFNPWNERHWLKTRFFDPPPSPDVLAITTDYTCNEWLDDADRRLFDEMRRRDPHRYRVAGLGDWGVADGLVYDRWEVRGFDVDRVRRMPLVRSAFGLDYGYTNDPTALFCGLVLEGKRLLFVFDELYERGLTNRDIAARVKDRGYAKERILADSAEPKSNDELRFLGLTGVRPAAKGKDSILNGIQYLQGYRILIHPRCVHFAEEIGSYAWEKDDTGAARNRPRDSGNHLMDAMRYAMEPFIRRRVVPPGRRPAAAAVTPQDMKGGWDV